VNVRLPVAALTAAVALALAAAPAHAAKQCSEPGPDDWQRATPAEAGMDAAGLQDAVDFGTANLAFAVRIYRHGCLVQGDRLESANRNARYESWSLGKSVTAMIFGRAMTLGLIRPEDVVGSLAPEADAAHGKIRVEDLLTMTSGLKWNGLRDYNIFTMPDRIRDALTLPIVKEPGTWFEYHQSPVSLLAELVGRSAGTDIRDFAQKELFDPLGIEAGTWNWVTDRKGNAGGFYGVNMRPDDFARLGDLMRRGGVWNGKRLLSQEFVTRAVAPSKTNGCYGWLIWVNAGTPCIGPRITSRPVDASHRFPKLPRDMYSFNGLLGQLVTVFPTQDVVVVRNGVDSQFNLTGGQGWEATLYDKVLASLRDTKVEPPASGGDAPQPDNPDNDAGFQTALAEPDQFSKGVLQAPLPPAGPRRARAPQFELALDRVSSKGTIVLRVFCPPRPAKPCSGRASLPRTRSSAAYEVPAGDSGLVRLTLKSAELRKARKEKAVWLDATLRNDDEAGGVAITHPIALKPPPKAKAKRKR
jgi:CubicO group peptidase (beta-lactamase class C family)